jgi:hypothetical protein
MAERELPKLLMWVRFPSPAPFERLLMDPLIFCLLVYVLLGIAAKTLLHVVVFGVIFGSAIYTIVIMALSVTPSALGIVVSLSGGIILMAITICLKKGFMRIWRATDRKT